MISNNDLLTILEKEFATTLKVMHAFPVEKSDFKPHDKSLTAIKLVSIFVFELYLMDYALGGPLDPSMFGTYQPSSVDDVITEFTKLTTFFVEKLRSSTDEQMSNTVEFAGKPFTASDMLLMLIHDQIHHRGQLTIYVRMAGGQVPSIYGPSADDTSTNL